MGTDPILTEIPLVVPAGLIICLIALTVTAWPVLAGGAVTARRLRQATWGSWACLAAVALALSIGFAPGLDGFLTVAATAIVAASTLLRRQQVTP
ncbi:hypothetical protein [Kocuria aegyptia]|uniref:Uncharacterized protein n=1 Tax=Kocuria aegyptia TaxID=330943 RepID=A0ABP4W5E1_9MICC